MHLTKAVRQCLFVAICAMVPVSASWAQSDTNNQLVVITVDFGTTPEKFEQFKQIMRENAMASVADESGCRQFDIYEVATVPNHLFLYEVYDNEAAFQQHLNSAHYKRFNQEAAAIITSRVATHGSRLASYQKPK